MNYIFRSIRKNILIFFGLRKEIDFWSKEDIEKLNEKADRLYKDLDWGRKEKAK